MEFQIWYDHIACKLSVDAFHRFVVRVSLCNFLFGAVQFRLVLYCAIVGITKINGLVYRTITIGPRIVTQFN